MLQGKLVLTHLTQNGANIEVDVRRVEHLQAVVDGLLAEVQIVVLDLESLLQVREGRAQFLCTSENACEIIISNCSVFVAVLGERLSLAQQLKCHIEVLY